MSPPINKDAVELGRQTAITLMKEMKFLQPPRNLSLDDELVDEPEKLDLAFQTIDKQSALHTQHDRDFAVNIAGLRYCVADGEVTHKGLFDIDHAYAHSTIKKKQEALLDYLNSDDNKDFASGFLSAQVGEGTDLERIDKYFGRDSKDNRIKGKRYFYKLCFNDIDNLLLLCHACNMSKNSKDSLEWFGKQEPFLGAAFVKAVEEAGGLHEGVIVEKIMKVEQDTPVVVISGVTCVLHQGEGIGLGSFVRGWFDDNFSTHRRDMMESYKGIWMAYREVVEEELRNSGTTSGHAQRKARISPKMASMLQEVVRAINTHYGLSNASPGNASSSQSDDSADRNRRIEDVDEEVKLMLVRMHQMKKLCNGTLRRYRGTDGADKAFIYQELDSLKKLETERQVVALNKMNTEIENKDFLSKEEIQSFIQGIIEPLSATYQEKRAEAERQERLAAEQRAEVAEQEIARLKAELQQTKKNAEENKVSANLGSSSSTTPGMDAKPSSKKRGRDNESDSDNNSSMSSSSQAIATTSTKDTEAPAAKRPKTNTVVAGSVSETLSKASFFRPGRMSSSNSEDVVMADENAIQPNNKPN